jgi:indole-3-glycerol phosphate synthase
MMKTNNILSEIIENKRFEVDFQKRSIPQEDLQDRIAAERRSRVSMRESLAKSTSGIIAEFKRRSPSKGWIKQDARIEDIIPAYKKAGASALSILTDEKFFGGTLMDLRTARPLVDIPILRKDFIIDEYQLYQAKIVGADAVLLIAAALEEEKCKELTEKAHQTGLEVLLEIHSESELVYITPEIDMIGINNRNLGTFYTNVDNSFRLVELLPENILLVSESGISDPDIVKQLRRHGFRGFLMGETWMKTVNPGETLSTFIRQLKSSSL